MPSYDYRCHTCDGTFVVTRSVHDEVPALVSCPCGHADTIRVFAAVAVAGASTGSGPREPASGCCGGGCCG